MYYFVIVVAYAFLLPSHSRWCLASVCSVFVPMEAKGSGPSPSWFHSVTFIFGNLWRNCTVTLCATSVPILCTYTSK